MELQDAKTHEHDRALLIKARNTLVLLLAVCQQTLTALEPAAKALETNLSGDLGLMIERTEAELQALVSKISALPV